jgi:uncharacterized protein (DUF362 family)
MSQKPLVSIVRYEKPLESVRRALDLSKALDSLPHNASVFVKPNIVFWTMAVNFPKWGVITTSRVIEDVVTILKERGAGKITIGEGVVVSDPKDKKTPAHAFENLGYGRLAKRFGVKAVNVMDEPFVKLDVGDGDTLKFCSHAAEADLVFDVPVLKTHNQTMVSLGIKNLKGTIDIPSRKKCHSADPEKNLHWWVARLADKLPPVVTVIDGLYSLERGPAFDGKVHRTNLLVASKDVLSADKVGAAILGYQPQEVPHLRFAAENRGRVADLSDVEIVGENLSEVTMPLGHDFAYSVTAEGEMPMPLAKQGIKGLYYRKYDLSMCTYCSALNGLLLTAIRAAWQGGPFDKVEVLTGKAMEPAKGMNKTILVGQCMVKANKNHPNIKEAILIKGCPPNVDEVVAALNKAGIQANSALFDKRDELPGFFMARYAGKPEFEEAHFTVE